MPLTPGEVVRVYIAHYGVVLELWPREQALVRVWLEHGAEVMVYPNEALTRIVVSFTGPVELAV